MPTDGPGVTARLSRLRIAGFKSFADPVEIDVLPGLTGVVGPNGCGKSNVADALRWVMGEANPRTLRGGEMDDVIFAGTDARPRRHMAEVSITLRDDAEDGLGDKPGRGFPGTFAGLEAVQVTRRIERGSGSAYTINGRDARARDVHALLADLGGGARSSALVSQGRVGALVTARPEERRSLLDEAAGIGGLHARRAEADSKLQSTNRNLERVEQEGAQLDAQVAGLLRQAKQAERYQAVVDAVRDAERASLLLDRARADAARSKAADELARARDEATRAKAAADAGEEKAAAGFTALPALRRAEAAARGAWENARAARQAVAADAVRARDALRAAASRRDQLRLDVAHAAAVQRDAEFNAARLAREAEQLKTDAAALPTRIEAARAEAERTSGAVVTAETEATMAAERAAGVRTRRDALAVLLDQAVSRARRAEDAFARLRAENARVTAQIVDPAHIEAARRAQEEGEGALGEHRVRLEEAEHVHAAAAAHAAAAREEANRVEGIRSKLAAEAGALAEILGVRDTERWPPMLDLLHVPAGLEAALGAALGEDLDAAADRAAARHWRVLPALPDAAAPGQTLWDMVDAPAALSRALGAVGVVADAAAGDAGQRELLPGQSLVSADGAVWRWDGYTVRAGTSTAATVRLEQRNRLSDLQARLAEAADHAATSRSARVDADAAERECAAAVTRARLAHGEAGRQRDRARQAAAALQTQAAVGAARLASLHDQIAGSQPEAEDAAAALAVAREQHAAAPDDAAVRAALDEARAGLAEARARDAAARQGLDTLIRDDAIRSARRRAVAQEHQDWRMRAADAAERVADLAARLDAAEADHTRLAEAPRRADRHAADAAQAVSDAEASHRATAEALDAADRRAAAAVQDARAATEAHSESREALVRAEGAFEAAEAALAATEARFREHADGLEIDPGTNPPSDLSQAAADRARNRLERLRRERDAIGPVNLLAATEMATVSEAAAALRRDRDELLAAVATLRASLGQVEREGRERLEAVFGQVDQRFRDLFARLFGGGRAHLALVGSDDPLQAGLEIYAQPPGKRLAALSLLSGGEQALAALSLLFAVVQCKAAPVCVLDEVDAPLDDANVDRLGRLLAEMAAQTGTRIVVVTHHPVTMARLDRMYGVTMAERGVSRLLSVDLQSAVEWAGKNAAA